ncbi:hypothetical protein RB653_007010 [Dictyostelium firmibasis]|uniref:Dickkopf N-terminal cysteine-rich domain-containing protein n=1 Tax=Dictyostelium firmibasis TaxID=79012 RepID=A0AAN7TTX2_9MYCE
MKFIYGLLALAASIVTANAQFCSIGLCLKEGDNCSPKNYNFTNNNVVDFNCEWGTFCPTSSQIFTPVCTKYSGPGETCGTPFTDCMSPYQCRTVNTLSTCAIGGYLGFGEDCNTDYQCGSGLYCVEGACSLKPNVICNYDGECPFGQWCNGTSLLNTPVQCQSVYASGSKCTRDGQCSYDNYCGYKDGDNNFMYCQPSFNKKLGDACSPHGSSFVDLESSYRYECSASLTCLGGTCQNPTMTVPTGDCMDAATQSCPSTYGSDCQCTSTSQIQTGKCTPTIVELNANCQTSVQSLVQCAIDHECPSIESITLGPDSCIMKHCKSELCESNCLQQPTDTCGDQPLYAVCNLPSSSSVVLPSFVLLIVAIIALLF